MPDPEDIPEWEQVPEEEIPPALEKRWQDDAKRGVRAVVCRHCGWPAHQDELSCRHCGQPVELPEPFMSSLSTWLLKTPWGIVTFVIIVLAVIAFLV